ncbi:hypothetical protein HK101_008560 [Irineochytrium annulatum]|nr:hypothetical protein HK101_008560 [Irineochytrium annulatum]
MDVAQGLYEPIVCKPGHYCPNYLTMLPCPAGYFCPTGTVVPMKCGFFTLCPTGSVTQLAYGPLVLMVIIDGFLAIVILACKIRQGLLKRFSFSNTFGKLFRGPAFTLEERAKVQMANFESLHGIDGLSDAGGLSAGAAAAAAEKGLAGDAASTMPDGIAGHLAGIGMGPGGIPAANTQELRNLVEAFHSALGHRELRMNFKFDNLSLSLKSGKKVLEGVTGEIRSKRMTAIIGPSGAGKTTFMNVLMGKVPRTGGRLYINGAEAEVHLYRKIIGYVPQEDVMLRELTVREVVLHSARVRLPGNWTKKQVEDHVDNVLKALNLTHVANSFIGDETTRGVSGGQRKRVNIGMELAAAPLAIFLDEPTSGLDATAALEVADILQNIAHLGLTIVSVIHQPRIEIFKKFDDVLMIAPGGKVAYLGPIAQSQRYFESLGFDFDPYANMSDVLMDILSGKAQNNRYAFGPQQLVAAWENRKVRDYLLEYPIGNEDHESIAETASVNGLVMRQTLSMDHRQMSATGSVRGPSAEHVGQWLVSVNRDDEDAIDAANNQDDHPPTSAAHGFPMVNGEFGTIGSTRPWASKPQPAIPYGAPQVPTVAMARQSSSSSVSSIASVPLGVNTHHDDLALNMGRSNTFGSTHRYQRGSGGMTPTTAVGDGMSEIGSEFGAPHREGSIYAGSQMGMGRRVPSHLTLSASIVESLRGGQPLGSTMGDYEDTRMMDIEFHRLAPMVVKERGASLMTQMWYCHTRSLTQQTRATGALVLEIFVAMFAGMLMGISTQGKVKELFNGIYVGNYILLSPAPLDLLSLYGLLIGIGIALAGAPSGVKVFGEEKPIFWREAASGHSKLAYYLGKTIASIYRLILTSLHFTGMYVILAKPVIDVYTQYMLMFLQFWGVYGMSCIISLVVRRENASLLSVVVGLFAAVFCGYGPNLVQAKKWGMIWLFELSFNKWAAEAQYSTSITLYKNVYDIEQSAAVWGYSLNQPTMDFVMAFVLGVVSRGIGYILLICLHRDKQR